MFHIIKTFFTVIFYTLSEIHSHPTGKQYAESIRDILEYIKKHTKVNRKYSLNTDKFCLIESATFNKSENLYEILFKSARHSFRPPLINRNTTVERENPKTIEEGEIEKVHVVLKFEEDDVTIYMEKNRDGATINNIIDYFNHFLRKYIKEHNPDADYHFKGEQILRENFLEILNSLKKVSVTDVYYDKKILGGEYLNLSNRTVNIKSSVIVSIQSTRGNSIKEAAVDAFNKFNGTKNNSINKIRIKGKNDLNGDVVLNTDFIEMRETVDIEFDLNTGEINSTSAFRHLKAISNL